MSKDRARRRQIIRDYKQTAKTIGAYCIRNMRDQRAFVGISRDVEARLNRHRFMLRTNTEDMASLQADWNAHGEDAFEFSLLQELEPPQDVAAYDPTDDLLAVAGSMV